jgi:hypothetical protein
MKEIIETPRLRVGIGGSSRLELVDVKWTHRRVSFLILVFEMFFSSLLTRLGFLSTRQLGTSSHAQFLSSLLLCFVRFRA